MIPWLAANMGTILVLSVLLASVSAIIYTMRRDRKRGKNACGGDCAGCAGCVRRGCGQWGGYP